MPKSTLRGPESVITIDCHYVMPRVACAYLIVEGDRAAFVENNTRFAVPRMLETLAEHGLRPEQVDYAIITHVHLDHAGGSAALLEACPNATLLCHPRAARHVIDPSRLVQSSIMVYGEEQFRGLYGEIDKIPAERVRVMEDGAELKFGERVLKFLHTRGHANHHFCIHDSESNGIFTGDSFGIGYVDLQKKGPGSFLYPSSTPTDFDPDEARASVDRIVGTGADRAYLTHFGAFSDMRGGAAQMHAGLDALEAILEEAVEREESANDLNDFCAKRVRDYMRRKLDGAGIGLSEDEWKLLELDIGINAMGIAFVAEKRRRKAARS